MMWDSEWNVSEMEWSDCCGEVPDLAGASGSMAELAQMIS